MSEMRPPETPRPGVAGFPAAPAALVCARTAWIMKPSSIFKLLRAWVPQAAARGRHSALPSSGAGVAKPRWVTASLWQAVRDRARGPEGEGTWTFAQVVRVGFDYEMCGGERNAACCRVTAPSHWQPAAGAR